MLVAAMLLAGTARAHAKAHRPPPCAGGSFAVDPAALGSLGALSIGDGGVLSIGDDHAAALAGCPAVQAQVSARRRGTTISARWPRCGSAKRVVLVAKLAAGDCDVARVRIRAAKHHAVRFAARRIVAAATTTTTTTPTTTTSPTTATSPTTTTTLPGGDAPSAQQQIAAALAAGTIDYPTSLLYRTWAVFGDPRLPRELVGSGSQGDEPFLFQELDAVWDGLPAAVRDAIAPYRLRPDDPQSPFGPATPSLAATRAAAGGDRSCPTAWRNQPSGGGHFKVWICPGADTAADDAALARLAAMAESLWTPMTTDMGPPMPDVGGGDHAIDLYLVDIGTCVFRAGTCDGVAGVDGVTIVAPIEPPRQSLNHSGRKISSGYILLNRATPSPMKSVLAHEFFHVLQNAHNEEAGVHDTGEKIGDTPIFERSWFMEASAAWAEWRYVPDETQQAVYTYFPRFQRADSVSLMETNGTHEYASFVWPYFMQQEAGSPATVTQAWTDVEPAQTPDDVDDALDARLSFGDRLHDFAVRLVNDESVREAAGGKLLGDLQPGAFPHDWPRKLQQPDPASIPPAPKYDQQVAIDALGIHYERYVVPPETRWIELAFERVDGGGTLDVDVVGQLADGTMHRFRASGPKIDFCRDRPAEDVQQLFLVMTNHDRTREAKGSPALLRGPYSIEARTACPGGWQGEVVQITTATSHRDSQNQFEHDISDRVETRTQRWTITGATQDADPNAPGSGWIVDASWRGAIELHEHDTKQYAQCLENGGAPGTESTTIDDQYDGGPQPTHLLIGSFDGLHSIGVVWRTNVDDPTQNNHWDHDIASHFESCGGLTATSNYHLSLAESLLTAINQPWVRSGDAPVFAGEDTFQTPPDPRGDTTTIKTTWNLEYVAGTP